MVPSSAQTVVGFSVHTGWAAAVVIAGPPPRVVKRSRLDLAGPDHDDRFVFHVAAEHLDRADSIITAAERTARDRAQEWLVGLREELQGVFQVALPAPKKVLPERSRILASHPLLHSAEGELYRSALQAAAEALRIPVIIIRQGVVPRVGNPGPPWGKDQKGAVALAWAAICGSSTER